jgi:hypothetical protein
MASHKQLLYCEFLQFGILRLRVLCGIAEGCRDEDLLGMREAFGLGFEEANLLHHVHCSILEPDYEANDISFINWAFPTHIERVGPHLTADTARRMVEFYDGVPAALRGELTWHPSEALRRLADAAPP